MRLFDRKFGLGFLSGVPPAPGVYRLFDDAGVRLLYDVGYRFGPVTQLSLRGGYQGRTSVTGGPALGASFEYGF